MRILFLLSKQDLNLSSSEVIELFKPKEHSLDKNLLIAETNSISLIERLAYTKSAYKVLFSCKPKQLLEKVSAYNWDQQYKKDYSVKIKGNHICKEADLADIIWEKLKKPKANLKNAETKIVFFITDKNAYACLHIWQNSQDFNSRKAHNRPELHPTSLHPRLARACINLTGIRKGTITDTFCGSGGILIEAGLIGLKTKGIDSDEIMLRRAKINLDFYKVKNHNLMKKDSTKFKSKVDYLVTDLPYGKNTKSKNIDLIYTTFFKSLNLNKRAVIIFPDFYNPAKLLRKFKKIRQFRYYLHKSLSKKIILIEKAQ